MLVAVTLALFLLAFTFIVHYRQHFRIRCCYKARLMSTISLPSQNPQMFGRNAFSNNGLHDDGIFAAMHFFRKNRSRRCRCCRLTSRDGQKFDFFPSSFACYIISITLLCIILIPKFFLDPSLNQMEHPWHMLISTVKDHNVPSIDSLHTIPQHQTDPATNNYIVLICLILDYILVYGTMILSIWESLFSYYRYYTTKISTNSCQLVSTSQVLIRFLIYIIIFVTLFTVQMQIYYWIFPILILLHSGFNIYCNTAFAAILISKYKHFLGKSEVPSVYLDCNPYILSVIIHTGSENVSIVHIMFP